MLCKNGGTLDELCVAQPSVRSKDAEMDLGEQIERRQGALTLASTESTLNVQDGHQGTSVSTGIQIPVVTVTRAFTGFCVELVDVGQSATGEGLGVDVDTFRQVPSACAGYRWKNEKNSLSYFYSGAQ